MAGQDELTRLEAERDRLLSMIAYHNGSFYRTPLGFRAAPAWFVAVAITCGIGISIVAGVFAGQISPWSLFLIVVVLLLGAFATREITVFGITVSVLQIVTLTPGGPPAGEPEVRQYLADCEARIAKLKGAAREGNSEFG
jgi:hypothetical protein